MIKNFLETILEVHFDLINDMIISCITMIEIILQITFHNL